MYELDNVKKILEQISAYTKDALNLGVQTTVLSPPPPDPHFMLGHFRQFARTALTDAEFATASVERAIASVAPMEQLSALLYNAWDIDQREIKLLEVLTTNERYSYENGKLRTAALQTLRDVEESEWENEADGARQSLQPNGAHCA